MQHIHLHECASTQDYLLDNIQLADNGDVIVSAEHQVQGKGQYGRSWFASQKAIAVSFTLAPNEVLSMTSLEISVILVNFFKENYNVNLGVKWPNDLFLNDKKCAGILLHHGQKLVCGIGINLYSANEEIPTEFKDKIGLIDCGEVINKELFSKKLVEYIHDHRLRADAVCNQWINHCIHLDKRVTIQDETNKIEGKFEGIGEYGQCQIRTADNQLKDAYTGSLLIDN